MPKDQHSRSFRESTPYTFQRSGDGRRSPPFRHQRYQHLAEHEHQRLLREYEKLPRTPSGQRRGVKELQERFGVTRQYLNAELHKAEDPARGGRLADLPHPGRPSKWTPRMERLLYKIGERHGWELSCSDLTDELNEILAPSEHFTVRTVSVHLQALGWRHLRHVTRPELVEDHRVARFSWAMDHRHDSFEDYVDLDEKWFYGHPVSGSLFVAPNVDPPRVPVVNNNMYPKVLVVTAVAQPRPEYSFDGKIGMWPVVELYEARRNSTHHAKGDVYPKATTLNSEQFDRLILKHVAPAIRRKMPWARGITVQMDNAPPHCNLENLEEDLNDGPSQRRRPIYLTRQPPHSPDTNVNDIGLYHSLDTRIRKFNRFATTVEDVIDGVEKAWKQVPASTLQNLYADKQDNVQSIIDCEGANDYRPRHTR